MKAILLAALVAGCATAPPDRTPPRESAEDAAPGARVLMDRAANLPADRAAPLYLRAVWAFLDADDQEGARRAFEALEPGWLEPADLSGYRLALAKMALLRGDADAAQAALQGLPEPVLETGRGTLILSQVCAARADYDCALASLVLASGDDPAENERIWSLLNLDASLNGPRSRPHGEPALLSDWRHLHRTLVSAFSAADGQARVAAWLAANPHHPAALAPPRAVGAFLAYQPARRHVGLLLPLSGPLARAGEAVRDGFIAAVLQADAGHWLRLTIYDTASEPVPAIYERLLAEQVELIVGPLRRDRATSLNSLNPVIPSLVLNYLDPETVPAAGLQQVGLAIEDEAVTLSRRIVDDHIERALVFHNYDDWSLRARQVLAEEALAPGKTGRKRELTMQPLTDVRTITEAVGSAMLVSDSLARRDELAGTLGTSLEFLPRARRDMDAIIALIDNGEANALVPALRFHFADHLPVYASSQVARRVRPEQLAALSGFHISELPWFLYGDPVYASMAEPFDLSRNPFSSLIALGSDAFRLAERIAMGPGVADLPLQGSTGLLKPQGDGRLSRELAWGIVTASGIRPDTGSSR